MDNLTHTLFALGLARTRLVGRAAAAADASPRLRIGTAAWLVAAANAPDADIVVRPFFGRAAYFEHHRGITHALVGLVLQFGVLVLLAALVRRMRRREGGPSSPLPWLPIAVGLLSHPLLDFLNPYGVRPWLPFSERWYYGDLAFIVEPWLWLGFGAAAALGGPSTRVGHAAYALLALATSVVLVYPWRPDAPVPGILVWTWPAACVAIALLRARGVTGRGFVVAGFFAAALYLGIAWIARERVEGDALAAVAARLEPGERVEAWSMNPQLARPHSWELVAVSATRVFVTPAGSAHDGAHGGVRVFERGLEWAAAAAAADPEASRAWRTFARHPMIRREEDGTLVLTDARYWFTDFCEFRVR